MPKKLILILTAILSLALVCPAWADTLNLGLITVKDKDQAERLRSEMLKGADFEKLAREYSVGPAASRGGRLGNVSTDRIRSEYRAAIKGLKTNTPSAVVPTEEGFTILMLFAPTAQKPKPETKVASRPTPPPVVAPPPTGPKAPEMQTPAQPLPELKETPYITARSLVMSGVEAMNAGDFKRARDQLGQAIKANPKDQNATFFLQIVEETLSGKLKEGAVQNFAQGFLDMLNGKLNEARDTFNQASLTDPQFWQAGLFEAEVWATMGNTKRAAARLQGVLRVNPKSARAHLTLGRIAQDDGRLDEAKKEFETAAELEPNLAEPYYCLGTLAVNQGDYPEAETFLRKSIEADPYKEEAYNDIGLVLTGMKKPAEAEDALLVCLALNPDFAVAHLNLGALYAEYGKLDLAIEQFSQALAVDPNLAQAHNNLAAAYAAKKDWKMAILHLDKALERNYPVPKELQDEIAPHRTSQALVPNSGRKPQ